MVTVPPDFGHLVDIQTLQQLMSSSPDEAAKIIKDLISGAGGQTAAAIISKTGWSQLLGDDVVAQMDEPKTPGR